MSKFYYNNKQQQFRCSWGIIAAFATKIEMKAMVTEIWHVWDCTRKREQEIHRHQIANCIHSLEIQTTVSCNFFLF